MWPLLCPDRSWEQLTAFTATNSCHHQPRFSLILIYAIGLPLLTPPFPPSLSHVCLLLLLLFSQFSLQLLVKFLPFSFRVSVYNSYFICTGASFFVHVQMVAMATGTVVPSDVVVAELCASLFWVVEAFIEV